MMADTSRARMLADGGTRFLDELPEGWRYIEGANTAPHGWKWACNGESRFFGSYEHALVKQESEEK